jgi:hypothetical protein
MSKDTGNIKGTPEMVREAVEKIDYNRIKADLSEVKRKRTRKGPIIALTNFLELNTIELKVSASPGNWKKLEQFFYQDPEGFAYDFFSHFISRALEEIPGKKPRGRHKDREALVKEIKTAAGWLYVFFYYWIKKPLEDWPDYLKRLLVIVKKEGINLDYRKHRTQYKSIDLTLYCVEKIYGETAEKCGLLPISRYFRDPEPFKITYIHDYRRPTRIRDRYIKNKSPKEITLLAYRPPLSNVFKTLKII